MTEAEGQDLIREWLTTQGTEEQRRSGLPTYGYDLYLPTVIRWHVFRRGGDEQQSHRRIQEWGPVLAVAAWSLARRGILRPGIGSSDRQATDDGNAGFGFSVTPRGSRWLEAETQHSFVPTASHRFAELLASFSEQFGAGYHSRSQEQLGPGALKSVPQLCQNYRQSSSNNVQARS